MSGKRVEPAMDVLGGPNQARVAAPEAFLRWLEAARPNDCFVYAEACWLPKAAVAPVITLVRAAHDEGELIFAQERHPHVEGRYRYLAIRRARRLQPAPARRFVAREERRGRVNWEEI